MGLSMKNRMLKVTAVLALLIVVLLAAGCGGGGGQGGAKRLTGLAADEVVQTFFNAAKSGNLNEAGLYVSPSTANDPRIVIKYLTGSGLSEIKNANLLSLRKAAEQGNYAVVIATLQTAQNTTNIIIRPVGLEKVNGEWYIVDLDKIYQDAKYQVLQQLLSKI